MAKGKNESSYGTVMNIFISLGTNNSSNRVANNWVNK